MVKTKKQKQQELNDSTQKKIIDAALAEFIRNGLRGARMQEIADRAEINKALLHYYFTNKEGLYGAVVHSVIQGIMKEITTFLNQEKAPKTEAEMLCGLVGIYTSILRAHPDFIGMTLRELADGGKYLSKMTELIHPLVQRIMGTVVGATSHEKTPARMLPHLMINMMSMIWGTFFLKSVYAKILPAAGFPLKFNDVFYEDRVYSICALVSALLKEKQGS